MYHFGFRLTLSGYIHPRAPYPSGPRVLISQECLQLWSNSPASQNVKITISGGLSKSLTGGCGLDLCHGAGKTLSNGHVAGVPWSLLIILAIIVSLLPSVYLYPPAIFHHMLTWCALGQGLHLLLSYGFIQFSDWGLSRHWHLIIQRCK